MSPDARHAFGLYCSGKERFLKFKLRAEGMEEIMFFHTEEDDDVRILKLLDVYKLHKL